MKNLILIIAFLVLTCQSFAQTVKIVRSDVDSSRSDYVTATYMFDVDIIIEGIEKCYGVDFVLTYNQAQYVKFSEYKSGNFIQNGNTVILDLSNSSSDQGELFVGVYSDDSTGFSSNDSNYVISLKFAVSQSITHDSYINFAFTNPQAFVRPLDTVSLKGEAKVFKVHSYIDVWPGDANNDGRVNISDISKIGYYLGFSALNKPMRTFSRPNASTHWHKQRVLAWDSLNVSYADCDGNGDVTITDVYVVQINYDSTHSSSLAEKGDGSTLKAKEIIIEPNNSGKTAIPFYVQPNEDVWGATAVISWESLPNNINIAGIEKGNMFTGDSSYFICNFYKEKKYAEIANGSFFKSKATKNKKVLAYLLIDQKEYTNIEQMVNIKQLNALNLYDELVPLGIVTGVNDEEQAEIREAYFLVLSEYVEFIAPVSEQYELYLFDLLGNYLNKSSNTKIQKSNLPSGTYFAVAKSNNKIIKFMFSVTK